jgi:hypothetical protein
MVVQANFQTLSAVLLKFWAALSSDVGLVLLGAAISVGTTLIFEKGKEKAKKLALRVALTSKVRDAYDRIFKHSSHFLEQLYKEPDPTKIDVPFRVERLIGETGSNLELSIDETVLLIKTKASLFESQQTRDNLLNDVLNLLSASNSVLKLTHEFNALKSEIDDVTASHSNGPVFDPNKQVEMPIDEFKRIEHKVIMANQLIHYVCELGQSYIKVDDPLLVGLGAKFGRKNKPILENTEFGNTFAPQMTEHLNWYKHVANKRRLKS